jgi:hypothetical protein
MKRLLALLVTVALVGVPVHAQEGQASSPQDDPSPLPVSLDRIREALADAPAEPLRGLDERPHFRIEVRERQKIDEILANLDFKSGPVPPGGLYRYEQQRILTPSVQNPLAQPYAAFSQGELLTLALEALIEKYVGGRVTHAASDLSRTRAEQAARDEVVRALADYTAARPPDARPSSQP